MNRRPNNRNSRNVNQRENRSNYQNPHYQRKNNNEIKSVSTNISKDGKEIEENKKIIVIPKIKLFNNNKQNEKNIQEKPKKINTVIQSKPEIKIRPKVNRNIIPYKLNTFESVVCPICNKNINNMSNAIMDKTSQKSCHFECVAAELKKENNIRPNQRLAYVGGGFFAIIEDFKEDGKNKFAIIQKIQYGSKQAPK
ncbi:MAG: hypothetical protein A2Y34_05610 [Spirochaetes bacterium GWC1_27_15]|nr:MAG: hypothetical protein A2Z98_11820 [Spirochaetes bacterium GWB1_27_13]OHD28110.1 MAG: hypothetical protein A2Y34_05610 [Spirochaetes bacterium GWC1_27_15]